jgi:protein-S-isoprenylcysteine O-methyltransferase Ste14
MWLWIGIGLGAFLALSLVVGAALAAMLGTITRAVTELHEELLETEARAAAPPPAYRRYRRRRRRLELELHP